MNTKKSPPISITDAEVIQFATDVLLPNILSKSQMFKKFCKTHNIENNFLPDYTNTDITQSLTALLKKHDIEVSTKKVNLTLIKLNLLEHRHRISSKSKVKTFKALTSTGLEFGKNLISTQNDKETQPHYFEKMFPQLLELIKNEL